MDAPKILDLEIPDIQSLQLLYMPFLRGGGLFLPTTETYGMGETIFLILHLPETPGAHPVVGKIVWLTPACAQYKRMAGVGLQFQDVEGLVNARIKDLLSGTVDFLGTHSGNESSPQSLTL